MNDQGQPPTPDLNSPNPVYRDSHEQRHADRIARRQARWQSRAGRPNGWVAGAILILLGVVFMLRNMGISSFTNWWALFILIPAFGAYVAAWDIYQDQGRLTRSGISSLTVGIMLTVLAFIFLFDLALGQFWPVLLILAGLVLLVTALLPE
jgi:hypothetical protein